MKNPIWILLYNPVTCEDNVDSNRFCIVVNGLRFCEDCPIDVRRASPSLCLPLSVYVPLCLSRPLSLCVCLSA